MHPTEHLPAGPVALQALSLGGLPPAAQRALPLQGVACADGTALRAVLDTPHGRVVLSSDD